MTTDTPLVCPSWSSRTKDRFLQISCACDRYKPNCFKTFWTQLAYRFNGRTAQPLEDASPPGCDEPTSRCQSFPSIWTLGEDKPVIPGVTFIRWVIAIPFSTIRSLRPTFVSARHVCLSVKLPSAFTLFRTISDRTEETFVRLRYSLGGDRPSQTDRLTMSPNQFMIKG